MNVLVIDDDKKFSEPLLWQLKDEGYDVTYCRAVEEVLDDGGNLRVRRPDCIILDIMMPRGERYGKGETRAGKWTGLRLLEDIKNCAPDVPVIIVTVLTELTLHGVQRAHGEIVKGLLTKPVGPSAVVNAIKVVSGADDRKLPPG